MKRIVYVTPSLSSVSGGTRKLADHVAILRAHGFDAELVKAKSSTRLAVGPETLVVVPEVYGDALVDIAPPGIARVSFAQNGYLLDFAGMAPPGEPHPYIRCRDLLAVMVESDHTEGIVQRRFPELRTIRAHSSSNGRAGELGPFCFGPWPRKREVAYFAYKTRRVLPALLGARLPRGWSFRALEGTDEEVAEQLRGAAIFMAPITCEGFCATTAEAAISGALVVGWPGGPSRFPHRGYPATRGLTAQVDRGGPMEYLAGRSWIAPQDDIGALKALVVEVAQMVDVDETLAAKAERWSSDFQSRYSREAEVAEIVAIMTELAA